MKIAADMCVYTNHSFIHEILEITEDADEDANEAKETEEKKE